MYESGETNEDSKASMGRCYKELCILQTQIETKGAEAEEAYNIVICDFNKILEEIVD